MDEKNVGITAFLTQVPGFSGIYKARFADFIVREVELDGTVVRLRRPAHRGQAAPLAGVRQGGAEAEEGARRALEQAVGPDELRALEALASGGDEPSSASAAGVVLHVGSDKAKRTAVHLSIRTLFATLLSETSDDGASIRVLQKAAARREEPANKRSRFSETVWPGGACKYVHFVVVKENRDTMDVLDSLARSLGCKPSVFSYAGIKDRRAVTAQRVSAYKVQPDRLASIEERGSLADSVRLGDLRYASAPIKTGELGGNRFTIVLRAVPADEVARVDAAATALRERGFINFYGLQRFGNNPAAPTHHVGRALLSRRWREAIDLILAPRAGENTAVHAARVAYARNGDPAECLRLMPAFMGRERALLEGLAQSGSDNLFGTISRIPRTMRSLYLHAYQSFVWNCVASERIRLHGDVPVVGDLVHVTAGDMAARDPPPSDAPALGGAEPEPAEEGGAEGAEGGAEGAGELKLSAQSVRVLSQADIDSGAFSILDVLLPLPGTHVAYPTHAAGQRYGSLMAADGLDPHDMDRRVREHALAGSYRKLVVRPADATHELVRYSDPNALLATTDMDIMRSAECAPAADAPPAASAPATACEGAPGAAAPRCLHAVRLEFTLPAGCYATMALRELCKRSTELDTQIAMTAAAQ